MVNDLNQIYLIFAKEVKDAILFTLKNKLIFNLEDDSALVKSINVIVKPNSLEIEYADYGDYLDQGRKPGKKGIPISALVKWINQKKKKGLFQNFSTNEAVQSLAFALQKSIKRKGIKARNWKEKSLAEAIKRMDKVSNQLIDQYIDSLLSNLLDTIQIK
jgi:hypothetical protein